MNVLQQKSAKALLIPRQTHLKHSSTVIKSSRNVCVILDNQYTHARAIVVGLRIGRRWNKAQFSNHDYVFNFYRDSEILQFKTREWNQSRFGWCPLPTITTSITQHTETKNNYKSSWKYFALNIRFHFEYQVNLWT